MELSPSTFDELRRLIHRLCGLALSDDKAYLIRHRLEPLVRGAGCRDFEGFAQKLRGPKGEALHDPIVEAITTSETSFFRDGHPFEAFRRYMLPRLGELAKSRPVRLWCAAAATGQEPYSLAMLIDEYATANRLRAEAFCILATDVSAKVLAQAEAARYSQREMDRGLTTEQTARHFQKHGQVWMLREPVRRLVKFQTLNLTKPFGGLGTFEAIFCRNVLIYFDEATRRRICEQFYALLNAGGWLVLGSAENLYGISERFASGVYGETIVYCKEPLAA
jgi:chemotaxis protein methyltransferase CheR